MEGFDNGYRKLLRGYRRSLRKGDKLTVRTAMGQSRKMSGILIEKCKHYARLKVNNFTECYDYHDLYSWNGGLNGHKRAIRKV